MDVRLHSLVVRVQKGAAVATTFLIVINMTFLLVDVRISVSSYTQALNLINAHL